MPKKKPLVELHAKPFGRWDNETTVEKVSKDLEHLGFEKIGHARVNTMSFVGATAWIQPHEQVYCVLYDEAQSTWIDLFSTNTDDDVYSMTSADAPLLGLVAQRPTYFISVQLPKVPTVLLYSEFLQRRPEKAWNPVTDQQFVNAYAQLCAADSTWQEQHLKKASETTMQRIVADSYKAARAVRLRDPQEELYILISELALPEEERAYPDSLHKPARINDVTMVKLFLENDPELSPREIYYAIGAAANSGSRDTLKILMEHARARDIRTLPKDSPLVSAARWSNLDAVALLVEFGVDPAERAEALKIAQTDAIVALLKGEKIAAKPLKKESAGELLIEALEDSTLLMGREPDTQRLEGPARKKAEQRALELIRNLENKNFERRHDYKSIVVMIVETGSIPLLTAILSKGLSRDMISEALLTAASIRQEEMLEMLLKHGADVNHKGNIDYTALLCAAESGDPTIVERLLQAGANPKARAAGGQTPKNQARGPFKRQIERMLDRAVSAKPATKASSIKYEKSKGAKNPSTARGTQAFRDAMGQPEWCLMFIHAAPEAVSKAFASIRSQATCHSDVADKAIHLKMPYIFIFRLQGSPWSILARTIGWLQMRDLKEAPEDAKRLSERLKTKTVTYMAEDTSGCENYQIYENGKMLESIDWMGEAENFKSTIRKKAPDFGDDFPDVIFSELGIYLPQCCFDDDGYQTKLTLAGVPAGSVERLDCFELSAEE